MLDKITDYLLKGVARTVAVELEQLRHDKHSAAIRAGLKRARAKGRKPGRPRKSIDTARVIALRQARASWRTIMRATGGSMGTVRRRALESTQLLKEEQ